MVILILLKNELDYKCINNYPDYIWSNELYEAYKSAFKECDGNINSLLSVGGGDHISYALYHFDIKDITHCDISLYSFIYAMLKLSTIESGSFKDWRSIVLGSMFVHEAEAILKKSQYDSVIKDLLKDQPIRQYLITRTPPRIKNVEDFFVNKDIFITLKKKVKKIESYEAKLKSIWNLKQSSDLVLLSNAYNKPTNFDFTNLVNKDGFVVTTNSCSEFNKDPMKLLKKERHSEWTFETAKRCS